MIEALEGKRIWNKLWPCNWGKSPMVWDHTCNTSNGRQ